MGVLSSPLSRLIALLAVTAASSAMLGFMPRQKNLLSLLGFAQLLSTASVVGTGNWVTFVAGEGGCASKSLKSASIVLPPPALPGLLAPHTAVSSSIIGAGVNMLSYDPVVLKHQHAGYNALGWQSVRFKGSTQLFFLHAGLVMFKALPRHQFGQLQSKLFPAYFLFTSVAQAIALVSNIMLTGRTAGREVYVQVAGLACTLLNLLAIGKLDTLCIGALAGS